MHRDVFRGICGFHGSYIGYLGGMLMFRCFRLHTIVGFGGGVVSEGLEEL